MSCWGYAPYNSQHVNEVGMSKQEWEERKILQAQVRVLCEEDFSLTVLVQKPR